MAARRGHTKRSSLSTIDLAKVPPSPSTSNSTLPDYSREFLASPSLPSDQPPDYPDSADEADHESDDNTYPLAPPLSPRHIRRKLNRVVSPSNTLSFSRAHSHSRTRSTAKLPYIAPAPPASASDTHLDSLLERSVLALELSNTLLRSSMSTQTSISTIVNNHDFDDADSLLDARARVLSSRIRTNRNIHQRWLDDLDDLAEDVEELYQDVDSDVRTRGLDPEASSSVSRSLPSSSMPRRHHRRPHSVDIQPTEATHGRLHSQAQLRHLASPPPRALTQYVNVTSDHGDASETTSNTSSIYLPSTTGLRSGPQVHTFGSPHSSASTITPAHHSAASSLRRVNSSPTSSRHSRKSRSSTPQLHESRSRSRSSNKLPSPTMVARVIPPPIEELPSQSDSSTESPHDKQAYRTMECLRKILDEMPSPSEEKSSKLSAKSSPRSPRFTPRTPPVTPITGTSTTTTSISRLYTKSRHSTSTRAPSPPRHSSLKQRPSPLSTSMLSIPDLASTSHSHSHSATSSGRSTPRNVAFGPLPESYAGSKDANSPSRFKERKAAKARAKSDKARRAAEKGKGKGKDGGKEKDAAGEGSWWTVWLTGGSGLSMSSARHEERSEDRMARSWARPGFGSGLEEWSV